MADGKVTIQTDLDNSGFKSGLDKLKGIGSSAFTVLTTAIAATTTAMAGLIGVGVKYNAEIETLNTSFEVMTGSASKAAEITKNLKDLAASTPFELKDLAKTTQLLMQYGLNADDAQSRLRNLGDISQGSADKMQRIAMAYGQMSSAGKVMLEDVKQMIEAGFNPLDQISQQTGESMASLYDRISKGTLTVDEITTAMQKATAEGGMYFESMKKQGETLSGQISTLKDNFGSLAGTLSGDITNAIRTQALPAFNEFLGTLENSYKTGGITAFADTLGDGIAKMVVEITNQAPAFLNAGVQIFTSLIEGFANNAATITTSIGSLITSLVTAISNNLPQIIKAGITIISALITGVSNNLPMIIAAMVQIILGLSKAIIDNLPMIIQAGIQLIVSLIKGLADALPQLIAMIPTLITAIVKVLTDPEMIKKMIYAALQILLALAVGLIKAIPELIKAIPQIITAIVSTFGTFGKVIMSIGMDILKWIWNGVVSLTTWIADKFGTLAGQFFTWIKNGLTNIGDIGKGIVEGIWTGITNMTTWLYNKVATFCSGLLSGMMKALGEHSPSKITAGYGKYLAQGLGIGFGDEIGNVYKDMNNAIGLQNDKLNWSVQAGSSYNNIMRSQAISVNGSYTSTILLDGEKVATSVNHINDRRMLQYGY